MIDGLVLCMQPQEHQYRHMIALLTSVEERAVDSLPPTIGECIHALKAKKYDEDNPHFHEAMHSKHSNEYKAAMELEVAALQKEKTWNEILRSQVPEGSKVLPLTWVFKLKWYPDGTPRKFKARLCVRGDKQTEGVDYFEKYAPVVSWSTVRMLMTLTARENLKTRLVDFTNAFAQATLKENVYVELPTMFDSPNGPEMVLKLNKSLYGLVQAPLSWYNHLSKGLEEVGFEQSDNDPCLFFGNGMMVLVYVDDCIFFGKDTKVIDDVIEQLRQRFELTVEDVQKDATVDVFSYLGVQVTIDKQGVVTFRQQGLTQKILKYCGMDECNKKWTPASTVPLGTDLNGQRFDAKWEYATAIGMLLYLSSNSRPDIQYAVHQCARFTHAPKQSHQQAVMRICHYLKATEDKGLSFKPSNELTLDCYADADFAGLYNVENHSDPVCVKSRTGFVLLLGGCPLFWSSKLQTEIALSTTEAEYIVLSQAMRALLPLRSLLIEVGTKMQLQYSNKSIVKTRVWEDNNGALAIATNPTKISARTKHLAIKYHFFRQFIGDDIQVLKVDTKEQLADMFTKGLPSDTFRVLVYKLMGWDSSDLRRVPTGTE